MKLRLITALLVAIIGGGFVSQTSVAVQDSAEKKDDKQDKEEKEASLIERMEGAIRLMRLGDEEEGVEMIREISEDHPDDIRVALTLIQALQQVGLSKAQEERSLGNEYFYESAKLARKIKDNEDFPPPAIELVAQCVYNEACTFAIDGKNDEALKSLKESFELGFSDIDLAETDSDFGDLLEADEFKAIIKEAVKKAAAKKIEELKKSVAEFEPYEFDFDLQDVDGDNIKKVDFKGKVLIVDLWGTWCPPCRREIPSFIKLKKNYRGKLDVVGIAYERADDDEEALENVQEFMEDHDMNYRCALGTKELKAQIPDMRGYPTTLFIDATGKVRMELVGFRTYAELELVFKEIMKEDG